MQNAAIPPDDMGSVRPLLIGAAIPDVTAVDIDGQPVSLRTRIAQKPTVLVFYRGNW